MQGTDYNVALMVFFIPYVLFEVPSNIILAKFDRPSSYMGILVLCWGSIMTLMGVVQNFAGLCATRFFLGLFEAGFFPGAIYLVGQWYPPDRTQFRMALFYCASAASGAFSGLLAAAIAKMNGAQSAHLYKTCTDRSRYRRLRRLALDLHHRGFSYCPHGRRSLLAPSRLARSRGRALAHSGRSTLPAP